MRRTLMRTIRAHCTQLFYSQERTSGYIPSRSNKDFPSERYYSCPCSRLPIYSRETTYAVVVEWKVTQWAACSAHYGKISNRSGSLPAGSLTGAHRWKIGRVRFEDWVPHERAWLTVYKKYSSSACPTVDEEPTCYFCYKHQQNHCRNKTLSSEHYTSNVFEFQCFNLDWHWNSLELLYFTFALFDFLFFSPALRKSSISTIFFNKNALASLQRCFFFG